MSKQVLLMMIFSTITTMGLMGQQGGQPEGQQRAVRVAGKPVGPGEGKPRMAALAVGQGEGKQRVEAQMVAYLTNTLDLSPAEAEKFWPLYNEYKKKREVLRTASREAKIVDEMTDQEARQWLDSSAENERKLAALKENYNKQFLKVLPVKKVVKLHQAERGFKRELIQRIGQSDARRVPGKEVRKMKMNYRDRPDN